MQWEEAPGPGLSSLHLIDVSQMFDLPTPLGVPVLTGQAPPLSQGILTSCCQSISSNTSKLTVLSPPGKVPDIY